MAERGRCGGCGGIRALTAKGVVRSHRHYSAPYDDVVIEGRVAYRREGVCQGAGMPPVGPDEPLVRTQLADARRELADMQREVTRLRHYASALEHDRNAWKLRVQSLGHIHEANRALLDALRAMMAGDRFDAGSERFEAEMARIRAEFPVLEGS